MTHHIGWSEPRTAFLRKSWAEGLSASQIAKQLGGTTRNAVIGVVHRKGLQRGGHQGAVAAVERKPRPALPKVIAAPVFIPAQPLRIKRAPKQPKVEKPEKPAPKFDASPASLAAMALLGQAHVAQARRDGFRASPP